MGLLRKIMVLTYMQYDGANAAECLAWFNNPPAGQHGAGVEAPNGWVITSTDVDGTLHLDCPGGNGGGGFPFTWEVGGISQVGVFTVDVPTSAADSASNLYNTIDAPA